MVRPLMVEARPGFRIWLRYSDGAEGEVDLSYLAGRGVFRAWRERSFFECVRVTEYDAIAWGEEIELCPDALYLRITGKDVSEIMPEVSTILENA